MLALGAEAGTAAAQNLEIKLARLPTAAEPPEQLGPLPRPLAFGDIVRYRQIFALQREGRWDEVDRMVNELGDDLLLGHVLAERYLHPTAYRSSYDELRAWLDRYADLPQASRVHKLALHRKPAGARPPRKPASGYLGGADQDITATDGERPGPRELWRKGLAAWRAGSAERAAQHFTRLAIDERLDGEELARAAFWAARANLRARQPQNVVRFLRQAARGSDEFYGLLAQKMLDESIAFDWHEEALEDSMLELLLRYPAVQRAIALAHVGERELADDEVRRMAGRSRPELVQALVALAAALELPSAQMRLAQALRQVDGRRHDGALFPVPRWKPAGGYKLDPSLVYAIIRAESGFDPAARSPKGALGLMQVMPDTARHLAKSTKIAYRGDGWLLHPPNNMQVGQAWLRQLARTKTVNGSLIHLVAAYHAGEARLAGWLQKELKDASGDPLLFIESVPLTETRTYIKKVLANLWAYQARKEQPIPSLQALAENRWPEVEVDGKPRAAVRKVGRHARAD
jgi:soluble lytic murein transglycosylase-like protein